MLARQPSQAEIDAAADDAADDAALADYEARGGISHDAILRWVRSWGTEAELPRPEIGD